MKGDVVELSQGRDDIGDNTEIRYVKSESSEGEVLDTVSAIKDYVKSGRYKVINGKTSRPLGYGDIAVICRNTNHCRMIKDECDRQGIPAYLQGDVQIMCTREGKLALAWLRFVNNEQDPWAFVPIMADMDYTPGQMMDAYRDASMIPKVLKSQRDSLYRKRRRITDLLTSIFSFYNLDNDITQAIITTMSTIHRGSLLTISDVIRIIEDDIENGTTYPVENFIDDRAVTIMTMHKSKGLEFPAVICPFIDVGVMPSSRNDFDAIFFDDVAGIRCTKEIGSFGEYSKICDDWRTKLVKSVLKKDYSEERRLMFVAMSRAKQYETVICSSPSKFMTELSKGNYTEIQEFTHTVQDKDEELLGKPVLPQYTARRKKIGVHEILHFNNEDGMANSEGCDEVCGKGMQYGTEVHKMAEMLCHGHHVDESKYPEIAEIRKVLDRVKDADMRRPEIECGLPIEEADATLRGVIDLLVYYDDHLEIHDYKTDVSDRFESEYIVQLSIYAYAAMKYYNLPVECYIDYVSRGVSKRIDIVPYEEIVSRVVAYNIQ